MIDAVVQNLIDLRAGRMPAAATIVNPEVRPRFPFES
jgi:hypothetical protein